MSRIHLCVVASSLLWVGACLAEPQPDFLPPPFLGEPPTADPEDLIPVPPRTRAASITAPVSAINNQNRTDVVVLYHGVYLASDNSGSNIAWTGNVNTCTPGTVSTIFQQDVLRRINFFRAMTGLPGDIVFDAVKNQKSQASALMMSAQGSLSHEPGPGWACYTSDGYDGSNAGNLYLGSFGPASIDGFIEDPGSNNTTVGHRRWLLYPSAQEMGSGAIPDGSGQWAAQTIWVIGDFGPTPTEPDWTSWPNTGYVPYHLVYPRWSYTEDGVAMSSVNVSMTRNGQPISTTEVGVTSNTLVWEPDPGSLPSAAPQEDVVYQVTLSGAVSRSYTVTAIDPYRLHQEVVISGPGAPSVGGSNAYVLSAVDQATAYRVKTTRAISGDWLEGAENGAGNVEDGTSAAYSLISSDLSATGNSSFHLALPFSNDRNHSFTVLRDAVPSASSVLSFQKQRRYMSSDQSIHAEISTDGGESWIELWSQVGTDNSGDTSFSQVNLNLGSYAGEVVRIRFLLAFDVGSYYPGSSSVHGVFIDDIQVTQSQELVNPQLQVLNTTAFNFQPSQAGEYYLLGQPEVAGRYFGYGPATVVTAVDSANTILRDGFEN